MDQHQLARIRLLSSRFLQLQGLRAAFGGATIVIVMGSYLAAAQPTYSGAMLAIVVTFVLMVPGQWWTHRYYARTVGRQVPALRNWWPTAIFFSIYFAVGVFLDRRFPGIPAAGPTVVTVVLASVWVSIRDWPWRAHYLGVAAVVTLAFSSNVVGVAVIDRGMTLAVTFFFTGVAMVPAGLLDHRLLVKLMQQARQAGPARAGVAVD